MAMIIRKRVHMAKLAEGWHESRIVSIELRQAAQTYHGINDQIIILFNVGPEEIRLKRSFNANLDPRSALSKVIEALTGAIPEDSFDVEALEGMRCKVLIAHTVNGDGSVWEQVREIKGIEGSQRDESSRSENAQIYFPAR